MDIDLRIIATRRPKLLERTLSSVVEIGLKGFNIRRISMNIDPAFGDQTADAETGEVLKKFFPDAEIFRPLQPSFGAAVRRLWEMGGQRPFFHLEDDWIAKEPFSVEKVEDAFKSGVGAVTPLPEGLNISPEVIYSVRRLRYRFFGIPYWAYTVTKLGTTPKFLLPDFASSCAAVMDPRLDPEKQMRPKRNPTLAKVIASKRNKFLRASDGGPILFDIGREWRDERKIKKIVKNDVSTWEHIP